MNRITGLPPGTTPLNKTRSSKKTPKKVEKETANVPAATSHPKPVRTASEESIQQARVQYDLPEGSARQAMQEYLKVANAARREELAQLVGVDLYI